MKMLAAFLFAMLTLDQTTQLDRVGHAMVSVTNAKGEECMLIVGGRSDANGGVTSYPEPALYNMTTGLFDEIPLTINQHTTATAVKLSNGKVLVMGDSDANGSAGDAAEIYDPVTNSWSAAAPMRFARSDPSFTRDSDDTLSNHTPLEEQLLAPPESFYPRH